MGGRSNTPTGICSPLSGKMAGAVLADGEDGGTTGGRDVGDGVGEALGVGVVVGVAVGVLVRVGNGGRG